MYNLAIIQARMGASRLPNKVLMELEGKPVLWHVIHRVKKSKLIDEVVVATTYQKADLEIVKFCAESGIRVFAGSENDVLDRYYQVAKLFRPDNVIRITADCPLHDFHIIDQVIKKHISENNDYTSNTMEETFPDGLDCEIMKFSILKEIWKKAVLYSEREHVTQYILKNNKYKKNCLINTTYKGDERWTLDTEKDYEFIKRIFTELYIENQEFTSKDIYDLLDAKPEIRNINGGLVRNEGLLKSIRNDYIVTLEEIKNE